jgi:hypothetical protein
VLLKISNDNYNKHGADAIVSDDQLGTVIKLLQEWGITIKNPVITQTMKVKCKPKILDEDYQNCELPDYGY